jgi:hypothetical protein
MDDKHARGRTSAGLVEKYHLANLTPFAAAKRGQARVTSVV